MMVFIFILLLIHKIVLSPKNLLNQDKKFRMNKKGGLKAAFFILNLSHWAFLQ
jgi:hypothetical protein